MNSESASFGAPALTLFQVFMRFLRFGLMAWGGPVAQIAMIREELVVKEKWISVLDFNRVLAVFQALPGPEATELCVYFGMLARGRMGGVLAGLAFMLPGLILMLLLTFLYVTTGVDYPLVKSVFAGLNVGVIALIFLGIHKIGKGAIRNFDLFIIAVLAGFAHFFAVNFFIIIPVAGLVYYFSQHGYKALAITGAAVVFLTVIILSDSGSESAVRSIEKQGERSDKQVFASGLKAGLFTFGGAYTAIPFLKKDAVEKYNWMSEEQFLDGLALSGVLPAPLIIFATFTGYFGSGWSGAFLITIGIFLPAFLFTLIGFRAISGVVENSIVHYFLDGITAGVTGLIAATWIQLCLSTVLTWKEILILAVSLLVLYQVKNRFTIPFMLLLSALLALAMRL